MFDCTGKVADSGREASEPLRLGGLGWRALAPPQRGLALRCEIF